MASDDVPARDLARLTRWADQYEATLLDRLEAEARRPPVTPATYAPPIHRSSRAAD